MDWSSSDDDEINSVNMEDIDKTGSTLTVSEKDIEDLERAIAEQAPGDYSMLDWGIDSPSSSSHFNPSLPNSPNV